MRTAALGARADVPVIGQGTWQLEGEPRARVVQTLRAGLDAGMTHIDTAEMYGSGVVEEIVGEAIAGRRDEVFLASKVLPENASREGTLRACERSLRRLRTDRLDLYLLHWRGRHPLAETFAAFEQLRDEGKIRSWGVSNFDERDLQEALDVAPVDRIACNQVLYHLRERSIEHRVLPFCERHGIAVVGYSPFGSGRFPSPTDPGGEALAAVAKRHGARPEQIALAFLTRRPSLLTIPRTANPDHAAENARAATLELTAKDIAEIDAAFPRGRRRRLATL